MERNVCQSGCQGSHYPGHTRRRLCGGGSVPPPGRSASAKNQRPDESRVGRPPFQRQGDAPRGAPDSASDLVRPAPGGFLRHARFAERAAQGLPDLPDRRRPATRRGVPRYALRDLQPPRDAAQPSVERRLPDDQAAGGMRRGDSHCQHPHRAGRHGRTRGTGRFGGHHHADFPGQHPGAGRRRAALGQRTCCAPGTGSRWPNTAPTAM